MKSAAKTSPARDAAANSSGVDQHSQAAWITAGCRRLLGYNLAQAAIPSLRIFEKRIGEPFQLRRLDFTILMLVASNPQVTQRQISLALDVSAPRLTLVCDKLVERELITRTRSEDDRRKQYIALTRQGHGAGAQGRPRSPTAWKRSCSAT